MKKKILSLLTAFAMVFGIIAAPFTSASAADAGEETTTPAHKTVIRIHKIVMPKANMDAHTDEGKTPKYDGTEIQDIQNYFTNGKEVAGVAFDIYKELDATETDAIDHNDPILGGKGVDGKFYKKVNSNPLITTADGIDTPALDNGAYVIVEDKEASTYVGSDGKAIAESKAIPTRIVLPMTKPDGTKLFGTGDDKLHIYPKNTEEKPRIDKNFLKAPESQTEEQKKFYDNLTEEQKNAIGADYDKYQAEKEKVHQAVGTNVPYEVKTEIPQGSEYKTIRWEDTMTKGLTFNKDLEIKLGTETFNAANYTLTQNASGFTLTLNENGLNAVKEAAKTAKVEFTLTYTAKINESAIVDKEELNNIKFDYSNKKKEFKDPVPVKPSEGKINVTKTWADGNNTDVPTGVTVKYYLYEKGTAEDGSDDKVVASVEKKAAPYDHEFTGLDNNKQYYVKEIVIGYNPEYSSTEDGKTSIKNTKDNENPKPLDPSEPKVVTHGARFVKTDAEGTERLKGAEFVVKNEAGNFLTGTAADRTAYEAAQTAFVNAIKAYNEAIKDGKTIGTENTVTIGDATYNDDAGAKAAIAQLEKDRDAAWNATLQDMTQWGEKANAIKLTSNDVGQFEIAGLAPGKYTLVETKAPEGFALPSNEFDFEIDEDGQVTKDIDFGIKDDNVDDNAKQIINNKVTIPQTGGIGSIIFIVAGLAIMGGAFVAYKKSQATA